MADPHDHLKEEFFFITSALSYCICLLQILGICLFNKYRIRGLLIIKRRYPRLVMMEAFVACWNLLITYPTNTSLQYSYFPLMFRKWWQYLSVGLTVYTVPITVVLETCRLWLMAYDLHYLHSSKNQCWKTVIDASFAEKCWYLRNRGKWGSQQYVIKSGFIYYITMTTAVLVMTYLVGPYFNFGAVYVLVFQGACLAVPLTIPLYLYAKSPRNVRDQLLFRYVECNTNSFLPAIVQQRGYIPFFSLFGTFRNSLGVLSLY